MFERVRNTPYAIPDRNSLTPFAQCMPEQYKQPDAVKAYRAFYIGEKLRFARWRSTPPPYWLPEEYR